MSTPTRPASAVAAPTRRAAAGPSQVVLVTGASSGAGEAIARRLAADGHRVVLGARRTIVIAGIAQELELAGGQAICRQLDVTRPESFQGFAELALREFGRVDVLVNAAGLGAAWSPLTPPAGAGLQGLDVPLRGLLHGLAAVLPAMQAQRAGHVVTLTPPDEAPGEVAGTALREACTAALRALSAGLARAGGPLRATTLATTRSTPADIAGAVADALRH